MHVYAFTGPDRGRIKDLVAKLYTQVSRECGDKPEKVQYWAGEDSLEPILVSLRNLGLFTSHTFAVVNQAESFTPNEIKALKNYVKHPSESATLVLLSDETKTGSDKLSFLAKDKLTILYEMSEVEKKAYIQSTLDRKGYRIGTDALDFLAELVSSDTADIQNQCSMLASLAPQQTEGHAELSLETVETYVFHSREETVYTLFEVLMGGDLGPVLESVRKILLSQENEAVGIVIGLQMQYRNLLSLKEAGIKKPSYDDFKARKVFFKRSQQYYQIGLDKLSTNDVQNTVSSLARYDRLLREARTGSHTLLLEMLMYELCAKRSIQLGDQTKPIFLW